MDGTTYNMANVFDSAFGVIPVRYQITDDEQESASFDYSGMDVVGAEDIEKGKSWLGTPINFKFSFKGGTYQYYENGELKEKEVEEFQLPLSTMVTISRSKRDRLTPVAGGDEEVIEMYAHRNWSVRIQGICLYDPGHPQETQPRDQRNRLYEFEDLADTIELVEDDGIFTDLAIYGLYIRSIRFGQVQGKPNNLPFEMICLSSKPIELFGNV